MWKTINHQPKFHHHDSERHITSILTSILPTHKYINNEQYYSSDSKYSQDFPQHSSQTCQNGLNLKLRNEGKAFPVLLSAVAYIYMVL